MANKSKDLTIVDLSGGMNEYDAPISIPENQCLSAVNVEFVNSPCGERRLGAAAVTITGSGLEDEDYLSWLHRHLPSNDETASELWAFGVTPGTSSAICKKTTTWSEITPTDAIGIAGTQGFKLSGASFNNKLFLAHKSTQDRLHVWDGTTLRRVGLKTPTAAPTGANTAAGGSFTGVRYYRIRYTVQSGGTTILRSEPSAVLTFTPSGSKTGVTVTKPATISESETHWELEASTNNVDFYRVATTVVATTTVDDTVAYATGYAASGTLSATSGDYTVPISCRFLSVDNDRLIMAGSWETTGLESRISWTVVTGDTTGVGNDERVPIATTNFLDLDRGEGGAFTNLSGSINGYVYVSKMNHLYRLVRTGILTRAYEAFAISKQRGALEGSFVEGFDQAGNPCLFFLDPKIGPCQVGNQGLVMCGLDITTTWQSVNIDATNVICRGLYYPNKHQVRWWVSTGSANTPDLELVLHTNNMKYDPETKSLRQGWVLHNGPAATALSACLYADNIQDNAARSLRLVPFIGRGAAAGVASILQLEEGTADAGTNYFGLITTKPYSLAGILNFFGVMAGAVLAEAASGVTAYFKAIRDFGLDSDTVTAVLTPAGSETHVIALMDDFHMSKMRTFQAAFGDDPTQVAAPTGTWTIHQIAFKPRSEDTA